MQWPDDVLEHVWYFVRMRLRTKCQRALLHDVREVAVRRLVLAHGMGMYLYFQFNRMHGPEHPHVAMDWMLREYGLPLAMRPDGAFVEQQRDSSSTTEFDALFRRFWTCVTGVNIVTQITGKTFFAWDTAR